jgi:hypothetical protein
MRPIKLNIIFFLLLLPFLSFANERKGSVQKEKTLHKIYQVSSSGTVFIDNSYGNINISTWQKNLVEISVNISVDGNSEDIVNKQLQYIDVTFSQNGSQVKALTNINSIKNSWSIWSLFGNSSKSVNFKINYEVKMPINHNLKISNDYGNISIDELNGNLDLNADYGRFNFGNLNGKRNNISVDYFSTSSIDFVNKADIRADYSRINIGSAYALDMACDYSTIKIDKVRRLKFSNDYGSISVKNSTDIKGEGDYQRRIFDNVNNLQFEGDYGSVTVDNISANFEKINLICDYVTIKIKNPQQVPYRFIMNQDYGCFKNENLYIRKNIQDGGEKHIEGYYKNENAQSVIKIVEDYGCVKIYN